MASTMNTTAGEPIELQSSDGCKLAVWRSGNRAGRPVVLLHGFSLDHSVWDDVTADPGLAGGCDLVVPDLRGHGRSGHPDDASGYTDGRLWADDLRVVIESLALHRPVVVAWSYSGRMVNDYLRHCGADKLAGVVFVAAATLADASAIGPSHACLADLCSSQREVEQAASVRFLDEVLRQRPGSASYDRLARAIAGTTPQQRAWLRARALDYDRLLEELDLPVLVVHGGEDSVVLPLLAQRLGKHLRRARVSMYPECGHVPFLENRARFCSELRDFIDRTDATA